MKGAKRLLPFALLLALLPAGCREATGPAGPGNQANERISITNDAGELAAFVTYFDDVIPIEDADVGYPAAPPAASSLVSRQAHAPFQLKLKGEIAPPSIGGQTLQATSVSIVGQRAVVSYSMVGSAYLGAIDIIDISNSNNPALKSRALFQTTDISAVFASGATVFAAEATSDVQFPSPAVFEVMQLVGNNLVLSGNARVGLTSFVATSTAASGSRAYATTGDNGGLFVLDPVSLGLITSVPLADARWVAVGGGKVVVAQGTPGRLAVFDETTLSPLGTYPFAGADIAESKSTVALVGGKAFIAAGSAGVQVLSASTGAVVGSVPRPDPVALGLDPSVVVSNAAAVDGDLLFIANGEAGVYVAQGGQAFAASGSEAAQQITMLGRLGFSNLQSVNHVAYDSQNQFLVVAAGLGGLKMVKVY